MDYQEFAREYEGVSIDFDNMYGAQCVDLTRFYWQKCLGLSRNEQPNTTPSGGAKDLLPNVKNCRYLRAYSCIILITCSSISTIS